jgi:hypothetical protein
MTLLDLQAMEAPGGRRGRSGGAGSTLTVLGCVSARPSNLSLLLCQ